MQLSTHASIDPQQVDEEKQMPQRERSAVGSHAGPAHINSNGLVGNSIVSDSRLSSGRRLQNAIAVAASMQDLHGILHEHKESLTAAHARAMLLRLRSLSEGSFVAVSLPAQQERGLELKLKALLRTRQQRGDPHPFLALPFSRHKKASDDDDGVLSRSTRSSNRARNGVSSPGSVGERQAQQPWQPPQPNVTATDLIRMLHCMAKVWGIIEERLRHADAPDMCLRP